MNQPQPTAGWVKLLAIAVIIAVPSAVALSYALAWFQKPNDGAVGMNHPVPTGSRQNTPFIWPGIRKPETRKAHEADLRGDEPVIGVVVDGRSRAYRVKAMVHITEHVVNDVLGPVPVTVTYDDRDDRAQVFTAENTGKPLEVDMAGYFYGLMLRLDGRRYFMQQTGREPGPPGQEGEVVLAILPHTRTTWKAWRESYPETDAYVGQHPEKK